MAVKVVFSKDKWYEEMSKKVWPYHMKRIPTKEEVFKTNTWANRCDGMTADEMRELGFEPDPSWMVEVYVF